MGTKRPENMKTGIVLLSCVTAVAACAQTFPQAMVVLDSSVGVVPIYYVSPGTRAPGAVFVEVLASVPGANNFISIDVMSETENTVRFLDLGRGLGSAYYFFDGAVDVKGIPPIQGAYADFVVRAWTGAASYDTADIRVESPVTTQITVPWNGPPDLPPENLLAFSMGMTMGVLIPEPGTIALIAMGGAALFLRFRLV
jgi:hypothetical protein